MLAVAASSKAWRTLPLRKAGEGERLQQGGCLSCDCSLLCITEDKQNNAPLLQARGKMLPLEKLPEAALLRGDVFQGDHHAG